MYLNIDNAYLGSPSSFLDNPENFSILIDKIQCIYGSSENNTPSTRVKLISYDSYNWFNVASDYKLLGDTWTQLCRDHGRRLPLQVTGDLLSAFNVGFYINPICVDFINITSAWIQLSFMHERLYLNDVTEFMKQLQDSFK